MSEPTQVDVHHASTRLSELIARVQSGEEFVIARAGRPVARLQAVGGPTLDLQFARLPGIEVDALLQPMTEAELADWH